MCPDICSVKLDKWQVDRNHERVFNRKSSSQCNVTTAPPPAAVIPASILTGVEVCQFLQPLANDYSFQQRIELPGLKPSSLVVLLTLHLSFRFLISPALLSGSLPLSARSQSWLFTLWSSQRSLQIQGAWPWKYFSPRKRRKASTCQSVILGITFHKGTQSSPCLNPSRLGRDGEQRGRVSKWLRWAVKGSSNYYVCRLHVRQRLQNVQEWRKLYSSWWRSLRSAGSWLTDFLVNWILTCLLRKLVQGRVCKEHGKKNTSF